VSHWFYLYIPWFLPLVMLALVGRWGPPRQDDRPVRANLRGRWA
jgi:hypothetical protein